MLETHPATQPATANSPTQPRSVYTPIADQGVDFAGRDVELDVAQRVDARVALADLPDTQPRLVSIHGGFTFVLAIAYRSVAVDAPMTLPFVSSSDPRCRECLSVSSLRVSAPMECVVSA